MELFQGKQSLHEYPCCLIRLVILRMEILPYEWDKGLYRFIVLATGKVVKAWPAGPTCADGDGLYELLPPRRGSNYQGYVGFLQ